MGNCIEKASGGREATKEGGQASGAKIKISAER